MTNQEEAEILVQIVDNILSTESDMAALKAPSVKFLKNMRALIESGDYAEATEAARRYMSLMSERAHQANRIYMSSIQLKNSLAARK